MSHKKTTQQKSKMETTTAKTDEKNSNVVESLIEQAYDKQSTTNSDDDINSTEKFRDEFLQQLTIFCDSSNPEHTDERQKIIGVVLAETGAFLLNKKKPIVKKPMLDIRRVFVILVRLIVFMVISVPALILLQAVCLRTKTKYDVVYIFSSIRFVISKVLGGLGNMIGNIMNIGEFPIIIAEFSKHYLAEVFHMREIEEASAMVSDEYVQFIFFLLIGWLRPFVDIADVFHFNVWTVVTILAIIYASRYYDLVLTIKNAAKDMYRWIVNKLN